MDDHPLDVIARFERRYGAYETFMRGKRLMCSYIQNIGDLPDIVQDAIQFAKHDESHVSEQSATDIRAEAIRYLQTRGARAKGGERNWLLMHLVMMLLSEIGNERSTYEELALLFQIGDEFGLAMDVADRAVAEFFPEK